MNKDFWAIASTCLLMYLILRRSLSELNGVKVKIAVYEKAVCRIEAREESLSQESGK
jgi:hypothetical protein